MVCRVSVSQGAGAKARHGRQAWRGLEGGAGSDVDRRGWQASHREVRSREARLGTDARRKARIARSSGCARHGTGATRQGRHGQHGRGVAGTRGERRGKAGTPSLRGVSHRSAWQAPPAMPRRGCQGTDGFDAHGSTWIGRHGFVSPVVAGQGGAKKRHGRTGKDGRPGWPTPGSRWRAEGTGF